MWLDLDMNRIFPSVKVLEMRSAESQAGPEDPRLLGEGGGGPAPHGEAARRSAHGEVPHGELPMQPPYTLNFSFEELNTLGLDEGAPRHSNLSWQVLPGGPCFTSLAARAAFQSPGSSWCTEPPVQKLLNESAGERDAGLPTPRERCPGEGGQGSKGKVRSLQKSVRTVRTAPRGDGAAETGTVSEARTRTCCRPKLFSHWLKYVVLGKLAAWRP